MPRTGIGAVVTQERGVLPLLAESVSGPPPSLVVYFPTKPSPRSLASLGRHAASQALRTTFPTRSIHRLCASREPWPRERAAAAAARLMTRRAAAAARATRRAARATAARAPARKEARSKGRAASHRAPPAPPTCPGPPPPHPTLSPLRRPRP